jgi:1-deoxy-D-xylulose-5-phosphate synthase
VLNIGLPDRFVEQGTREELLALCGLDSQGLIEQIEQFCA